MTALAGGMAALLALAGLWPLQAEAGSAKRDGHEHVDAGSTLQSLAERQGLLKDGERRLRSGDAEGALQAFEQAALQAHEAGIELGILRAQMQAGAYRQALAFAAHTAGVHADEVEGGVLYAWLLNLGGQVAMAEQTLRRAEAAVPDHPMVKAARQRFEAGSLLATGVLSSLPARLAPFASGARVDSRARTVAAALLLADGRHALAPLDALPPSAAIWVRDGLGLTVPAMVAQADEALGLALLALANPLPVASTQTVPSRDAFPGSPAFAADYPNDPAGLPAWPVMRLGFLGAPLPGAASGTMPGMRRLGIDLPGKGPRGGPVYDQGGRLVGMALGRSAAGIDRMVSVGTLRNRFGERFGVQATEQRPAPVGADELYERAMKTSLQLLVTPP